MEERSSQDVLLDPANLYRCLRRMSTSGWIEESTSTDDRRRVYRVTTSGKAILRSEVQRLESLLRDLRPSLAGGKR